MRVLTFILKSAAALLMVATPLLGTWGASSLATFVGGSLWVAGLTGLALFPLVPLTWEAFAHRRWARREPRRERYLTFRDRIILRTLAVNGVFLAALLGTFPAQLFTALSARGDWFLDGQTSPRAQWTRAHLFVLADKLEWLFLLTQDNPYAIEDEEQGDGPGGGAGGVIPGGVLPTAGVGGGGSLSDGRLQDDARRDTGAPDTGDRPSGVGTASDAGTSRATVDTPDAGRSTTPAEAGDSEAAPDEPDPTQQRDWRKGLDWPLAAGIHPAVHSMPEATRQSLSGIAQHIIEHEQNPYLRVKAIHDYVADHVRYDFAAYDAGTHPPYDAETVNRTANGVCAGYAMLFKAIAKRAGFEAEYIVGDVRDEHGEFDGDGHAWNAVQVEGRWYLVDVTWDSPHASREPGELETHYLFTPPELFVGDHLPDKPGWQLLLQPLSRGDFLRQPMLAPAFHAERLVLIDPQRSHLDVRGTAQISLQNPGGRFLLASLEDDKGLRQTCGRSTNAANAVLRCDLWGSGIYRMALFSNDEPHGSFSYLGRFAVRGD